MKRRETDWRRREIKRMQEQQLLMKRRRVNSDNLRAIQEALMEEDRKLQGAE